MTQNIFTILQGRSLLKQIFFKDNCCRSPQVAGRFQKLSKADISHPWRLWILQAMRFACRWFLFQALSHHRCACKWSRLVLYEWAHTVERQIWNRYLIEAKDNNHQSQQYTHNGKSGTTKPFSFNIDTKNSGWSLEVNISVVLKLTRSYGKTRICPFRHQYFHGRHRFESLQPSKRKPNQSPEGRCNAGTDK